MNHVNQNAQGLRYLALDSIFSFPDLLATMLQKHPKSYFDHYNSIMSYQYSQNIAKPNKKILQYLFNKLKPKNNNNNNK